MQSEKLEQVSTAGSTKTRLTLYFTALFGAIVICLAVTSYLLFARAVYSDLDSGLKVAVGATLMSAQHEMAEHTDQRGGEADLQSILDESRNDFLPDTQIMIREGARTVAYKNSTPESTSLRAVSPQDLRTSSNVNGLRIAASFLALPQFHSRYEIYSASALDPALAKLRFFRQLLFVCVPLGLALAACAGYLLARRALAPLTELTRTIETVTSSDLSARVSISQSEGDLGRLAAGFNSLLERLESAFNIQRQFMADASHELRTPLTVALSAAQVTARDGRRTVADCDQALSLVEAQLLRLSRIIDNLLFLSQADATSLHIQPREFYLDDVISEAVHAARALARPRRQTIKIENLPEARCQGDEDLVRQAILILLDNSVKYTQDGGVIEIALCQASGFWACRVANNGPSIPLPLQHRIFERFFRAETRQPMQGSGLGLPIARSIAETHAGSLVLVSSVTGSTIFEFKIPAFTQSGSHQDQPKSFAVKI